MVNSQENELYKVNFGVSVVDVEQWNAGWKEAFLTIEITKLGKNEKLASSKIHSSVVNEAAQLIFICPKSAIETLEKGVSYVQS